MRYNSCITRFTLWLRQYLASNLFFYLIIGFFAVQALWIGLSAIYPQAFDEDFHFGIIQIYAHHWLPFLSSQPSGANQYGAITRDPSFLYHYLMSFPYRIIASVWHTQMAQVLALRVINVGLFIAGLLLFRRVLQRLSLPRWVVNSAICIISFIPVIPQLAGQINYDNLLFPLSGLSCVLAFRVIDDIRQRRVSLIHVLQVTSACLLASMVKYEFLPIALAILLSLTVYGGYSIGKKGRLVMHGVRTGWRRTSLASKMLVPLVFVVSFGLFAQRDIGNIVNYHALVPDCSEVLDIHACSQYSVWLHDYTSHEQIKQKTVQLHTNPFEYVLEWIYWLWYRLFFAINGPASSYQNWPPLPLPAAIFILMTVGGVIAIVRYRWKVLEGSPYLIVTAIIIGVYLLTLLGAGYLKYLHTGVLELMNGRYLLPILPLGLAVGAQALRLASGRPKLRQWRLPVASLIIVCMIAGGGVFTFIARSEDTWYWHNSAVYAANHAAQRIFKPILIKGPRYYTSNWWFFN